MKYYATYVEYYTVEVEADEDTDVEIIMTEALRKLANNEDIFVDGAIKEIIDENDNYIWED